MPFGYIHQDIIINAGIGIQDKVDIHARRVLHDSHRFRAHGSGQKLKTELLIKLPCHLQIRNPDPDVIDTCNLFHLRSPACQEHRVLRLRPAHHQVDESEFSGRQALTGRTVTGQAIGFRSRSKTGSWHQSN
eukprot:UN28754